MYGHQNLVVSNGIQIELAKLLEFVSRIATAIRMNSAYNGKAQHNPHASFDVMWLADSLHNLDGLGRAILEGKPEQIAFTCDRLVSMFEGYASESTGLKSEPKHTFDRWSQLVDLRDGIDIFRAIKAKALAQTIQGENS